MIAAAQPRKCDLQPVRWRDLNDAGAKQPGSVGFGPQSGSQNRDVRQLRSRASHLAVSSGISPKLIPGFANRARSAPSLAFLALLVLSFQPLKHPLVAAETPRPACPGQRGR